MYNDMILNKHGRHPGLVSFNSCTKKKKNKPGDHHISYWELDETIDATVMFVC